MGVRVVMELSGDNDQLHERNLSKMCDLLDAEPAGRVVDSCVITTGKVTIEEEMAGMPNRRLQRQVR